MASEIGDLYVILRAITEPFKASMASAAAEGEAATGVIGGAFNKLAGVGMAAGGVAIAIGAESVKLASDFQTLTQRLVTTAGESQSNLELVRKGILQVSNDTAASANDLAKGMYIVEAAGYRGADGIKVLKAATEGAKLEGSDFATVSNAVTDILKDYHLPASQAADVTSQLVAAVGSGKANFQDMSASMSNVLPLAAAVHLKFSDVGGVLAEMTSHGVSAQRASENIADAMRHLVNPSGTMIKEFEKVGITTQDVQKHLSEQGLGGTMQWLSGLAQENASHLGQTYPGALRALMGTAAGLNVALMTTGENANDTKTAIANIAGASADAQGNVAGFSQVQQTFAFRLDQVKETLVNLGIKLGTMLLPYVERFLGWVQKGIGWLTQHKGAVEVLAGAIGTTLVAAIIAVGGALASALGPELLIAAGIMAVGAAVVYAYTHFKTFHNIVNEIGRFLAGAFSAAWKAAGQVIDWFRSSVLPLVKEAIKAVFDWFAAHKEEFKAAWDGLVHAVEAVAKWFNDNVLSWIRARIAELVAWWHDHSAEIKEIWSGLFKELSTIVKLFWDGGLRPLLVTIQSMWTLVWGAIRDALKMVWDEIVGIVTFAVHLVEGVIGVALDILTGHWGKAWHDLGMLVFTAINDVVNFLEGFGRDALHFLEDAGKNIVKGLINGIKSAIGGVKSVLGDLTDMIPSWKGPPGRDRVLLAPAGRSIIDGLIGGIGDRAPALMGQLKSITADIAGSMHGMSMPANDVTRALGGAGGLPVGGMPMMTAAPAAAGPAAVVNNYFNIAGSVLSERDLRDTVEQQMYQLGMRGSQTWQPYQRR